MPHILDLGSDLIDIGATDMAKRCDICGWPKGDEHHFDGVCDMAELSNGRIVAAKRIDVGGDLHEELGEDLKVVNRWVKKNQLKKDELTGWRI